MNKPLGGRGKKAPYETQVVRVPVPILAEIEAIVENYRLSVLEGEEIKPRKLSHIPSELTEVNYSEALHHSRKILRLKTSASKSLAKLLQVLYRGRVREEDLR